jgi:hypothetical protein
MNQINVDPGIGRRSQTFRDLVLLHHWGLQSWVSKRGAGRKTSPTIAIRLLAIGIYQKLRAKTMASTARAGTMAPLGEGFGPRRIAGWPVRKRRLSR